MRELKRMVCIISLIIISACNIGNEGETKEECILKWLPFTTFFLARSNREGITETGRQAMIELANLSLVIAATCKDEDQDIFSDIFN